MTDSGSINGSPLFADVILPFPLHKAYTYRIPASLTGKVIIGQRVLVQFGKKKIFTGIVSQTHSIRPDYHSIKEIEDILDETPVISSLQLEFWKWLAGYYCCSVGEVMAAALPGTLKLESESLVVLNPNFDGDYTDLSDNEYMIAEALEIQGKLSFSQIESILSIKNVMPVVKSLYLKGVLLPMEEIVSYFKPKKEKTVSLAGNITEADLPQLLQQFSKAPRQADLIMGYKMLRKEKEIVSLNELLKLTGASAPSIASLVAKGVFEIVETDVSRIKPENKETEDFELKDFQQTALEQIREAFDTKQVVLLHGITSSGKTHVYFKLIDEYVAKGKQVLYLVPEIALTAQLIRKMQGYFGDKVGIFHSKYSANERHEIWYKALNNEYSVILGVRSALFLPLNNPGLIIIDEEHENTFKQQDPAPRYHARDSAIMLAAMHGAKTLLGTATPSFESYLNAKEGKYGFVVLNKRFTEVQPPFFKISDLTKATLKKQMRSHLTLETFEAASEILAKGDQIILFQNRRGYAPYLECNTCNHIPQCKNCDISLTYHKQFRQLRCHYCGYKQSLPSTCPSCGNPTLLMKGFGTEKIEDELPAIFPDYKTMRLDLDTTRSKSSYQKLISDFEKGNAQILVGTQMVTKGLDFEKVKMVAILNADQMLNYPDFRASERTFQLISQVGGRSGRRNERGLVIIQTGKPNHPVFQYIIQADFEGFYESEGTVRYEFLYPPFSRLIKLTIRHKNNKLVEDFAQKLANNLRSEFKQRVLGPEFPPVARLNNEYQMQILVKFERNNAFIQKSKDKLQEIINQLFSNPDYKRIRVIVDVDPY